MDVFTGGEHHVKRVWMRRLRIKRSVGFAVRDETRLKKME